MLKLQIIIASTRPGRAGGAIGNWFYNYAVSHGAFDVELVDLAQIRLPFLDEEAHPRFKKYEHEHTKAWSARIESADAYVMVTPEYNYGSPPSLVNALDCLSKEWAYKPVGFVSYGGVSAGTRSVQMTKQIVTALKMMPMAEAVAIPFFTQFLDKEKDLFTPPSSQEDAGKIMLDELLKWAQALRPMRA